MANKKTELCLKKLLTVSANRQCKDIFDDIKNMLLTKYLSKKDMDKILAGFSVEKIQQTASKSSEVLINKKKKKSDFKDKLSFFTKMFYTSSCANCSKPVDVGDPGFINGTKHFHINCAIERFGAEASSNKFFQVWSNTPLSNVEELEDDAKGEIEEKI